MEETLLKDSGIYPTNEVLEYALGESYLVFYDFIEIITGSNMALVLEWRYYNDGKAWLCKVCFKKKTVFWLSVWNTGFKLGFYFTEKNCAGVTELDIDTKIKEEFGKSTPIGKLIPLVILMNRKEQLNDALKLIEYKKSLK